MKRHIDLALVVVLAVGVAGALSRADEPDVSTEAFLSEALSQAACATRASSLALERAASKEVRLFARKTIEQQSNIAPVLIDLAWSNRVPVLINQANGRDVSDKALAGLKGAAFDRAYLRLVVDRSQRWAEVVRRRAAGGPEMERGLAARMLPPLRERAKEAKRLLSLPR